MLETSFKINLYQHYFKSKYFGTNIGIPGCIDDKNKASTKSEDTDEDLNDMTVVANSETRSSQPIEALNVKTENEQGENYVLSLSLNLGGC